MAARQPQRIILASASPRRAELLKQIGLPFDAIAADVDERLLAGEAPADYVERLAHAKALAVWQDHGAQDVVVLGSDTTVVIEGEILSKPAGPEEGQAMLRKLSDRVHTVFTGVAVYDGLQWASDVVSTQVHFHTISQQQAQAYWATGEPQDKAGGYGIQGIGGIFVRRIEGSYSAVVGLPIERTEALLRSLNIDTWSMRVDG